MLRSLPVFMRLLGGNLPVFGHVKLLQPGGKLCRLCLWRRWVHTQHEVLLGMETGALQALQVATASALPAFRDVHVQNMVKMICVTALQAAFMGTYQGEGVRQHCWQQREGCSRGHPLRGSCASLTPSNHLSLPLWRSHGEASPSLCFPLPSDNTGSDRVETALNRDGGAWGVQKIYCPVHHSAAWLQTDAHVHASRGNKPHTLILHPESISGRLQLWL